MDELQNGSVSMSLEDQPEIVGPAPTTPEAPAQAPPPVTEAEDPDPDGTISGAGGIKFVPLGAVKAERERRQAAERAAKDKDAEVASYKDKAAKYDEAADKIRQGIPIIEKIRNRPDILKMLDQPPAPVTPAVDPALEAEALEMAKDLDLFMPDGKHDVAKALRILQRTDQRAAKQAQQAVSPILQTEAQRQSNALYQYYAQQPEINGFRVDPKVLAEHWKNVPAESSADPRIAHVLYMNAIGQQVLSGQKPIVPLAPVVPTESLGGAVTQERPLSDTSERFRTAAGIQKKTFTELRETFKPGQSNSLE